MKPINVKNSSLAPMFATIDKNVPHNLHENQRCKEKNSLFSFSFGSPLLRNIYTFQGARGQKKVFKIRNTTKWTALNVICSI